MVAFLKYATISPVKLIQIANLNKQYNDTIKKHQKRLQTKQRKS